VTKQRHKNIHMNKETLIKKWLDNELTAEELLLFQQLEEYDSYIKLSKKAALFCAPEYQDENAYKKLSAIINQKRKRKLSVERLKPFVKIAAVLLIGVVVYTAFFGGSLTNIETFAMQQKSIDLPDASHIALNANSSVSFNKKSWESKREVNLDGEAYFQVEKGSQFDVKTSSGIITVVGTQFNIKNRLNYFEVKCFEGKVNVIYNGGIIPLPAGSSMRVVNNNLVLNTTELAYPTWIDKVSSFESVPLSEVLAEFKRQYNLKVKLAPEIDMNTLFTGSFSHSNKENAIKSITVPFGLDFTINNDVVTLNKIE
jgi:transmembrane sensor